MLSAAASATSPYFSGSPSLGDEEPEPEPQRSPGRKRTASGGSSSGAAPMPSPLARRPKTWKQGSAAGASAEAPAPHQLSVDTSLLAHASASAMGTPMEGFGTPSGLSPAVGGPREIRARPLDVDKELPLFFTADTPLGADSLAEPYVSCT